MVMWTGEDEPDRTAPEPGMRRLPHRLWPWPAIALMLILIGMGLTVVGGLVVGWQDRHTAIVVLHVACAVAAACMTAVEVAQR